MNVKIIEFGFPILRTVAAPVTIFDKKLGRLLDSMRQTLYASNDSAALAAPQIAVSKRVVVMDYKDEYLELVNPSIVSHGEETEVGIEGCLSLPNYSGLVPRYYTVEVEYYDRNGGHHRIERSGAVARCLQHEIDHLGGILYIDRMQDPFVRHDQNGKVLDITKYLLPGMPRPLNPV
jgi:peptide deformylase